jgi:LysM repeat protein
MQSETAAELLVRTDFAFVLKKLEDKGVISLLTLLKTKSEESERFCIELLRSSRSDAVWQAAGDRLYAYAGELVQGPIDPKAALTRFAKPEPVKVAVQSPVRTGKSHVVKEGESLWKIARAYKVKLDDLVQLNGLERDRLLPGMTLKIPQGTGSEPPR